VIAVLDDQQLRDRETEAQATVAQSEARLQAAQRQIAVLEDQLRQNSVETGQSKVDANGRVSQAQASLAAAEADLAQQEAAYKLDLFDKDAYTRLAQSGAVSERQGKQAETTAETQAAVVAASKRRVEASRGALAMAEATLSNPDIHSLQAAVLRRQIAQGLPGKRTVGDAAILSREPNLSDRLGFYRTAEIGAQVACPPHPLVKLRKNQKWIQYRHDG